MFADCIEPFGFLRASIVFSFPFFRSFFLPPLSYTPPPLALFLSFREMKWNYFIRNWNNKQLLGSLEVLRAEILKLQNYSIWLLHNTKFNPFLLLALFPPTLLSFSFDHFPSRFKKKKELSKRFLCLYVSKCLEPNSTKPSFRFNSFSQSGNSKIVKLVNGNF